jgi:hypothetical protein
MTPVMGKLPTLTLVRDSLPPWQVWLEKRRGNAVVSDNSLLERVASVAKGFSFSHLTLEFASGQIVLGMNARDPFSAINVRITPGLA